MEIKIVSPRDKKIINSVRVFRQKNPGMNPNRSDEEQKIHEDKYCSDDDITQWVVALDNDEIVGTVAVFSREIMYDNTPVQLGGIGKVRVALDQRKKGVGSKMMKSAMEQLHENQADVAFLCTNLDSFLADWYKKYGFEVMSNQYTFTGLFGKKYVENDGMLAPIESHDLFQKIMGSSEILDVGQGNW